MSSASESKDMSTSDALAAALAAAGAASSRPTKFQPVASRNIFQEFGGLT